MYDYNQIKLFRQQNTIVENDEYGMPRAYQKIGGGGKKRLTKKNKNKKKMNKKYSIKKNKI